MDVTGLLMNMDLHLELDTDIRIRLNKFVCILKNLIYYISSEHFIKETKYF